ncbi:MAG: ATPase P [Deltaproteobacteria bacterium]|jgi:soluble P-type ATPase|nr:ATPase P [Deltaproteobacteria bacterium]MDL1987016.1 ATPase P [Deltaproteobacteria bacterium]
MIEIDIPGFGSLRLERLILDYNGTIAVDGQPVQGVKERLIALARHVEIHVLTADTFGGVEKKLSDIPCKIHVLPVEAQDKGKMEYVDRLGADRAVCIGNGRNDVMMLKKAALGIAVMQDEGAAASAVLSADVVVTDILFALDLISNQMRLIATLRS